jgi:hypothetical protein
MLDFYSEECYIDFRQPSGYIQPAFKRHRTGHHLTRHLRFQARITGAACPAGVFLFFS